MNTFSSFFQSQAVLIESSFSAYLMTPHKNLSFELLVNLMTDKEGRIWMAMWDWVGIRLGLISEAI